MLQKLQIVVDNSKLSVVACPQPSLVSEKYMGTRMRMWGAVADSKVRYITSVAILCSVDCLACKSACGSMQLILCAMHCNCAEVIGWQTSNAN